MGARGNVPVFRRGGAMDAGGTFTAATATGPSRPRGPRAARRLTLGVEEEFVLLGRADGAPALRAPEVLALLDGDPRVKHELMRYQLETVTGVCESLEQVGEELTAMRLLAARAAAEVGCHLAATGVAPRTPPGLPAVTPDPRYAVLVERSRPLAGSFGTCGCHVHVGMPSRELGVRILARLRPHLATLLAVSANSPVQADRDTGWASRRYRLWSRFPSARPPGVWWSAADYDAAVDRLLRTGRALDERGVYFHARLSPRYPTIELRVMDTCLSAADAVLVAGLARALVALAIEDEERGLPLPAPRQHRVVRQLRAAARHGLGARALDPSTGRPATHRRLLAALADRLPDPDPVARLLDRLALHGTGADRQRALLARAAGPADFARLLAGETVRQGR
ncbi:YbdK family carboxylate-amine ligase [Actinomadura sp. ATCC 31491]|uniref:Putative glutamate--cysteine ligase 2 n=1 Tax=Actinomadura luzonensis TaxID=2805427 RepID=A0ABT0G328_9ACTN|nr:YbdK family carboxylate-amine ligase [Actinomadura luzonensis]MCK2218980.1 YbdK family carboxylate-amine ligase [Actinomadura luzonensis]